MDCIDLTGDVSNFLTDICGVDANGNCLYAAANGTCTTNYYCGGHNATAYYCDGSCGFDDGTYGYNTDALGTVCGPANCGDLNACGRDSNGNCVFGQDFHDCYGNCTGGNDDCGTCAGNCFGDCCGGNCGSVYNYDIFGSGCDYPGHCQDYNACGNLPDGSCAYTNCDGSCTSAIMNPSCPSNISHVQSIIGQIVGMPFFVNFGSPVPDVVNVSALLGIPILQ